MLLSSDVGLFLSVLIIQNKKYLFSSYDHLICFIIQSSLLCLYICAFASSQMEFLFMLLVDEFLLVQ